MTDDVPDTCASCGKQIRGRPSEWNLDPEWRMYLEDERDLGWFANAPVVICCPGCKDDLDRLENSLSEQRAYGNDADTETAEAKLHAELDGLDLDCIVDQFAL
jgi:hypothetical protein